MDLALSAEQLALRDELQTYFAALITEDRIARLGKGEHAGGPTYREIVRQMGADGWLGVGWRKEWGGQGFTPIEQLIFFEEANAAGVPLPFLGNRAIRSQSAPYFR